MGKLHLTELTDKVALAAQSFFTACRNHAPDDSFYGLALCPDSAVRSFYWMANSNESLVVVFPAPDGPEEVKEARKMARKLNPPEAFAWFNGGYWPEA